LVAFARLTHAAASIYYSRQVGIATVSSRPADLVC
jgi:hypothetical protein